MSSFRAMSTEVRVETPTLDADASDERAQRVARLFERVELRFSRFRPSSELSRLNASHGPMRVSDELFDALVRALAHHELTRGIFDPAIGASLLVAGYDRSFAPGALDRSAAPGRAPRASLTEVRLDHASRTVWRPAHVQLDLGGMLKGHAVDLAASLLDVPGFVDAGGDARVVGAPPDADAWVVDVEDPRSAERTLLSLALRRGAIATSAPNRRRWSAGGLAMHHLIDPRTGAPARSDLAQVTVLAPTVELADVLAKTALVLGADEGARALSAIDGVSAVLAHERGDVVCVGDVEVIDA